MVKAIIFDIGGVLFKDGYTEFIKMIAKKYELDFDSLYKKLMLELMYNDGYVRNEITPEEFWKRLKKIVGRDIDEIYWRQKIIDGFKPKRDVLKIAKALKKNGYITAILSDHTDFLYDIDEKYKFLRYFNEYVSSYELGYSKPDREMYDAILTKLDLPPKECIFIDNWEQNVIESRNAGIKTILFRDAKQLKMDLRTFSVRI